MMDPFSLIPPAQQLPLTPFGEQSRYRDIALLRYRGADGREIVYVGRRRLPQPAQLAEAGRYQVREGDRLDNLAAQLLGDPELYWRIADANAALTPDELTQRVGRWLRITLPEGMPGPR